MKKINIIFAVLFLIFLIGVICSNQAPIEENNTNIKNEIKNDIKRDLNLKSSGSWPNCPKIHINNDNWSGPPDLAWIQEGLGTPGDFHIIENVTIDGGDLEHVF